MNLLLRRASSGLLCLVLPTAVLAAGSWEDMPDEKTPDPPVEEGSVAIGQYSYSSGNWCKAYCVVTNSDDPGHTDSARSASADGTWTKTKRWVSACDPPPPTRWKWEIGAKLDWKLEGDIDDGTWAAASCKTWADGSIVGLPNAVYHTGSWHISKTEDTSYQWSLSYPWGVEVAPADGNDYEWLEEDTWSRTIMNTFDTNSSVAKAQAILSADALVDWSGAPEGPFQAQCDAEATSFTLTQFQ